MRAPTSTRAAADASAARHEQLVFHLSGKHHGTAALPVEGRGLRPALCAPYRDLDSLRHDFPVVLAQAPADRPFVRSLSALVDTMLGEVAPRGIAGERMRRHALQIEHEIRNAVSTGATGTLEELWDAAAARLVAGQERADEPALEQVLAHVGGALPAQGDVLGCTPDMPARLLAHAWQAARRAKARAFHAELSRLVQKLSDILRAAYAHSQASREAKSLAAAVGGPHRDAFDFDALSRIVGKGVPRDELPPARRERLVRTLGVLESQRFFAPAGDDGDDRGDHLEFRFSDCRSAAAAFRARLDDVAALVKACAVAELEVAGRYVEAEHDVYFDAFDANALGVDDLARFPDYLVCIPPDRNDAPENANLMEMLSSGLPVKVLVQTTDLLEDASIGTGHFAFGVRSARLATTAMGLGGMFVLQSAASNLYALRDRIERALACRGPALVSVYTAPAASSALPPYLAAAAAMQSRSFPAFSYDASAGVDWATRFSLENNPAPDDDWPVEPIAYADAALQRRSERWAFTYADFALCDPRHARHFALVPQEHWSDAMLPVADWLALDEKEAAARVPYLLAVDEEDALQRVVVDARMTVAARRCLLLWRRLQEHGGVHDSYAERRLVAEHAASAPTPASKPVEATVVAATSAAGAAATEAAPSAGAGPHSRDEAWIDTARCPSCNECQLVNDRMFGYDERKQAFIRDVAAGTYRQLVDAAERCQVAIIHPGKPRDPNEPGLAELLERAEPFR
jgi:ferredoxin